MNDEVENKNGDGDGSEARTNTDASGRSNSTNDLEQERDDLKWAAMFNIAVNEDLERHYRLVDVVCKSIVAVFGTTSFATFFVTPEGEFGNAYKFCGLIVAIISILMLAIDFGNLRNCAKLQRNRYSKAYTAVLQAKSKKEMDSARRLMDDISNDDLPSNEMCDAIAVNIAIDRLGKDSSYKAKVNWFGRLTRFILPWGRPKYGHRD